MLSSGPCVLCVPSFFAVLINALIYAFSGWRLFD